MSGSTSAEQKLNETTDKVLAIKVMAQKNIELALHRSEQLEELEKKSQDLSEAAYIFQTKSKRVSLREKCKLYKMHIGIGLIIVVMIVLFAFIVWSFTGKW
jgi:hypothetical protein